MQRSIQGTTTSDPTILLSYSEPLFLENIELQLANA
jgi:hypothetical protein